MVDEPPRPGGPFSFNCSHIIGPDELVITIREALTELASRATGARISGMADIESVALDVMGDVITEGVVFVRDLPDRHAREALRAELRRLAREWGVRIRTRVYLDHDASDTDEPLVIGVFRVNDQPWDDPLRRAIDKDLHGLTGL